MREGEEPCWGVPRDSSPHAPNCRAKSDRGLDSQTSATRHHGHSGRDLRVDTCRRTPGTAPNYGITVANDASAS